METKHYTEEMWTYLSGELATDANEQLRVHLEGCPECRAVHDELLFGSRLASELRPSNAPAIVWTSISERIDRTGEQRFGLIPEGTGFGLRKGLAFGVALIAVAAIASVVFVSLFTGDSPYRAGTSNVSELPSNTVVPALAANENTGIVVNANTNTSANPTDGFAVETLAGSPTIEGGGTGRIGVGQLLQTDAKSTARISVADIGTVDVSPNSRVRLEETGKDEHRLSLERGKLHAKIYAPPRLFVVDTPSAKAVDLGCEYTLDVDKNGDSVLHVTGGWVALERDGRESIVPAGMMCKTRKGRGLGTPFNAEATEAFKNALDSFDFSRGGSAAVQAIIREAGLYDMFTLWHLLSRVSKDDRGAIFDALAEAVPPPSGVTREGILALNKKMLEAWKIEVENAWFS